MSQNSIKRRLRLPFRINKGECDREHPRRMVWKDCDRAMFLPANLAEIVDDHRPAVASFEQVLHDRVLLRDGGLPDPRHRHRRAVRHELQLISPAVFVGGRAGDDLYLPTRNRVGSAPRRSGDWLNLDCIN